MITIPLLHYCYTTTEFIIAAGAIIMSIAVANWLV